LRSVEKNLFGEVEDDELIVGGVLVRPEHDFGPEVGHVLEFRKKKFRNEKFFVRFFSAVIHKIKYLQKQ
jgi:hypothetical protein